MKLRKLVPMVDYIIDMDFMSTNEFCKDFGQPLPYWTGNPDTSADMFINIDAVKLRLIKEYAKFLNKNLTVKMFIGDYPMFPGFEVIETSTKMRVIQNKDNVLVGWINEDNTITPFKDYHKKVQDLIDLNLSYNAKE